MINLRCEMLTPCELGISVPMVPAKSEVIMTLYDPLLSDAALQIDGRLHEP